MHALAHRSVHSSLPLAGKHWPKSLCACELGPSGQVDMGPARANYDDDKPPITTDVFLIAGKVLRRDTDWTNVRHRCTTHTSTHGLSSSSEHLDAAHTTDRPPHCLLHSSGAEARLDGLANVRWPWDQSRVASSPASCQHSPGLFLCCTAPSTAAPEALSTPLPAGRG